MGNDKYNLNGSFTTMHLVFDGVFFHQFMLSYTIYQDLFTVYT